MSYLDDLEEIALQTKVTERSSGASKFGWRISPSIERASVCRAKARAIAKPAALIPADDEKGVQTMDTPSGSQEMLIISEPVTSYSELIGVIRTRVGQLGVRYLDFDKLAGWAEGLSGKIFGTSQVKRLGPEKLFDAIRASGMRIRLEHDPEQTQKMQARIAEHCLPRQTKQARPNNRSHMSNKMIDEVLSYLANRKGGLTILNDAAKRARSNLARRASKAFWEKKRERASDFSTNVLISNAPALPSRAENPCSAEANAA